MYAVSGAELLKVLKQTAAYNFERANKLEQAFNALVQLNKILEATITIQARIRKSVKEKMPLDHSWIKEGF